MAFCLVSMENLLFSLASVLKKRQHPRLRMLPQPPQKGKEKDALSVPLRLFSVLLTVLSILILTYKDLRFNSKTMPISRQNCANYLPPASAGKNPQSTNSYNRSVSSKKQPCQFGCFSNIISSFVPQQVQPT